MYYGDEHSKNQEALDLMVKMRSGANGSGKAAAAAGGSNPLGGLIFLALVVVPILVAAGIIPLRTIATLPVVGTLVGMVAPSAVATPARAETTKSHKHSRKGARKVSKHKGSLKVSHHAVGPVLARG